jgi:hypothetical protein
MMGFRATVQHSQIAGPEMANDARLPVQEQKDQI